VNSVVEEEYSLVCTRHASIDVFITFSIRLSDRRDSILRKLSHTFFPPYNIQLTVHYPSFSSTLWTPH